MTSRLMLVLAFLSATFVFRANAKSSDNRPPNILLICVDDLKPTLGTYGDSFAHTPNIDALAARGMRFNHAYCNQALCAPSRNSLMTGMRPTSLGIYDLGTNFRKALPNGVTLAQHFLQHGYFAEGLGKIFHTGHGNIGDEASWSTPFWAEHVIAYALPESGATNGLTREEALFANDFSHPIGDLPRGMPYESAEVSDDAYPDGRIADEAIHRLQTAKVRTNSPFFLAVGFVKPHLPFCAPKEYWDLYDRSKIKLAERQSPPDDAPPYAPQMNIELPNYRDIPNHRPLPEELRRTLIHGYYAATSYIDAQLGRVMAELDRLQLADNTIIVLWGDHGWHLGDHGMWCKHTNYEQANHIPFLIVAPHVTKPGTHSDALVETVDIYPTLCDLSGISDSDVPQKIDGTSLVPLLRRKLFAHEKQAVFHAFPRGTKKGNLLGRAVRTERYRLVEWKRIGAAADTADLELYDYKTDPLETKNLAASEPKVVAKLRAILDKQPEPKPPFRAN